MPMPTSRRSREVARELRVLGGELCRLVGPDVDDAGRDDERLGRLEQRSHARQPRRAAEPERAVAELLGEPAAAPAFSSPIAR